MAVHWLLGFIRHYFECQARREPYRSLTCFRVLWLPENWPVEACAKLVLPGIAALAELWLGHDSYRYDTVSTSEAEQTLAEISY
jgi:hypothetical protein